MEKVRSKTGTPVVSDFTSKTGTPIVINDANGNAYVLIGGVVVPIRGVAVGGGTSGLATVDFGAGGALYASAAVTGQTEIVAGSTVQATIRATASADHTADEHLVDPPVVRAGDIVAGTGFTIHAFTNNLLPHFGVWNVQWQWN